MVKLSPNPHPFPHLGYLVCLAYTNCDAGFSPQVQNLARSGLGTKLSYEIILLLDMADMSCLLCERLWSEQCRACAPAGPGMPEHCPGYFEALRTHITRTGCEDARHALRPA